MLTLYRFPQTIHSGPMCLKCSSNEAWGRGKHGWFYCAGCGNSFVIYPIDRTETIRHEFYRESFGCNYDTSWLKRKWNLLSVKMANVFAAHEAMKEKE